MAYRLPRLALQEQHRELLTQLPWRENVRLPEVVGLAPSQHPLDLLHVAVPVLDQQPHVSLPARRVRRDLRFRVALIDQLSE